MRPLSRADIGALGVRRWGVIAAGGTSAAERFAARERLADPLVLGKWSLLGRPSRLRELMRREAVDGVIVHSGDWQRQSNPQLYELALALLPARERLVVDERGGRLYRLSHAQAAARAARVPLDALRATGAIGFETLRFSLERARTHDAPRPSAAAAGEWILAVWPGSAGSFGGATTHISGILGGFRALGFRIALVTRYGLPEQLGRVVDDAVVLDPPPAAHRVTSDIEQLACNGAVLRRGLELARRLRPAFVYQRHAPFLVAGARIAEACRVPLVLEWNGSEAWIRDNWETSFAPERVLAPLLVAMERDVLRRAVAISAVSGEAARMAIEAGAAAGRVLVLPNAVDVRHLDAAVDGVRQNGNGAGAARLGWAGSFGPWHGSEMAVRALAQLPPDVELVMVGDGDERAACESLSRRLGVADRIEWTGALPHDAALRTLAQCDVLVSPHTPLRDRPFFGSPTKIFEYMALGRPIVASDLGQIGEILRDGVTARLVEPADVDDLVKAIVEVLRSPDRGRSLAESARRDAAANHTWDERARELVARVGARATGNVA